MLLDINKLTQEDINAGLLKVKDALLIDKHVLYMNQFVNAPLTDWNDPVNICNTPMCIAGHLSIALGGSHTKEEVRKNAETLTNYFKLNPLCYPPNRLDLYETSIPEEACVAIDEYLSGNYEYPWDKVIEARNATSSE